MGGAWLLLVAFPVLLGPALRLDHDPSVLADRPSLLIIADKRYVSRELDNDVADSEVQLPRPNYRNRTRPSTCSNLFGN
jgi:hypothetical protein